MWKLVLGFVVFAAIALYMISKGGDIDMGGEKHGADAHPPAASEPAVVAAPAPASAASAASAP